MPTASSTPKDGNGANCLNTQSLTDRADHHLEARKHARITDLEWVPLEFVCFNLREIDKREIYGNMFIDNPLALTAMIMQAVARKGVGGIGWYASQPAAWLAFFEQWSPR